MRRRLLVPGAILAVLAAGFTGYLRIRPAPAAQQSDLAITLAASLRVLAGNPEVALTPEQAKAILPFLRVLRDTDPSDEAASRALAEEIRNLLTPEQRAAIARMREDAQALRQSGQALRLGAEGRRGSGGPGGPVGTRAELRRQVLTRLIERLQARLPES